jgi:hypothetical protein
MPACATRCTTGAVDPSVSGDSVPFARQGLDAGMGVIASTSDPQTEAATRLMAWVSRGAIQPTADDFGMIRLALLSLLPQIGGILLMVARRW